MTRNLIAVFSGSALALGLAVAAGPAALSPALAADTPPTSGGANAHPGHPGQVELTNPGDPPIIRRGMLRPASGRHRLATNPPGTPIIRDANARPGHRHHVTITNQAAPPTVRD